LTALEKMRELRIARGGRDRPMERKIFVDRGFTADERRVDRRQCLADATPVRRRPAPTRQPRRLDLDAEADWPFTACCSSS
jgi:hypothetical protein